jgi:hypothetical protein
MKSHHPAHSHAHVEPPGLDSCCHGRYGPFGTSAIPHFGQSPGWLLTTS